MTESTVPEGVEVRRFTRRDATVTEVFSVRVTDVDGTRRRRSCDSLEDALDYRARLRSARRWRPEELRQEQAGTQTLGAFFVQWWVERAMPELARATLAVYPCLWEARAAPRLARLPIARDRRAPGRRLPRRVAGGGRRAHVGRQDDGDAPARLSRRRGTATWRTTRSRRCASPRRDVARRPSADAAAGRAARGRPPTRRQPPSAMLVRLMAYTGLRPQEALALH